MARPITDTPSITDSPKTSATEMGGDGGPKAVARPARPDGRQLRRQRNREAVVDALLDLYGDGKLRPSTEEIAARSGLSPRSLFRYFEDVDDLTRTAISRIEGLAATLVPIDADPESELPAKVQALVDQRFRLFGAVGNAAAVSRLRSPFQPILAERLKANRSLLRHQIKALFGPELARFGQAEAAQALAVADVLCSFEAHQLLLEDQLLSARQAKAAMGAGLVALFASRH
jgi:AcrR family transcriptional regulator